jgi:uncharacterized protein YecT (DUF1311 family)
MDPSEAGPEIPLGLPPRQPLGSAAMRLAQAAGMFAVVAVGVAVLSLFPHPRQAAPALPSPAPVRVAAAVASPVPVASPFPVANPPPLRPRIAPPPVRRRLAVVVQPQRPTREARTIAMVAVRRPPGPCRAPSVTADRLVCSEPALATLDRRMRAAYARAIAAGADRLEIDRAQARWHGARDRTTEPGQLAQLYARRIADLEAAAARPPLRRAPSGGQA